MITPALPTTTIDFQQRLQSVQQQITAACERAQRAPDSVRLLPVTKTVTADRLRHAYAAGMPHFAENKVQEAFQKWEELQDLSELKWSIIGHLQTNKAKFVAKFATEFQALDSLKLAEALDSRLQAEGRSMEVLIQVNVSQESSKSGLATHEVAQFLQQMPAFHSLQVRGLMTLAMASSDTEMVRQCFRTLRCLRDELRQTAPSCVDLSELSMGMSGDYALAIEEGSTIVRIGTALFGARHAT